MKKELSVNILVLKSMLLSKLKRQLEATHATMVENQSEFFNGKLQNFTKTKKFVHKFRFLAIYC